MAVTATSGVGLELVTLDTWITSDQHWNHKNIQAYAGRPDGHFELMRENWLAAVGAYDTILCLGDIVTFGDRELHADYLRGLTGRKLLIRGNHDYHKDDWYEEHGFTVLGRGDKGFRWACDDKIVAFSHEPLEAGWFWDINIHGHTHDNDHRPYTPVPGKTYINACVEKTNYAPMRLYELLDDVP